MSHIIQVDGKPMFQSDKYPDLAPNHIVLSFNDPAARAALWTFVYETDDMELAKDIGTALNGYPWEALERDPPG